MALEHQHVLAVPRQEPRAAQPAETAADHDDVRLRPLQHAAPSETRHSDDEGLKFERSAGLCQVLVCRAYPEIARFWPSGTAGSAERSSAATAWQREDGDARARRRGLRAVGTPGRTRGGAERRHPGGCSEREANAAESIRESGQRTATARGAGSIALPRGEAAKARQASGRRRRAGSGWRRSETKRVRHVAPRRPFSLGGSRSAIAVDQNMGDLGLSLVDQNMGLHNVNLGLGPLSIYCVCLHFSAFCR
jgi:hypothetical protein